MFQHTLKVVALCIAFCGALHAQNWRSYQCCPSEEGCESGWLSWDRLSFGAEFLWWKATEDNIAFAHKTFSQDTFTETTVGNTTVGNDLTITKTKKEEQDFKWRPGFRLNIDYLLPCQDWDMGFTWAHLRGHSNGSAKAPNQSIINGNTETDEFLTPAFIDQVQVVGEYDTIRSHWNLTFDDFVWEIGKTCCCSPCFFIRPNVGLKYLHLKQRLHINSTAKPYTISNGTETITKEDFQVLRTRFCGIGLQAGFDINWLFDCGFALYSNISGGVVYGKSHSHRREFLHSHSVLTGTTTTSIFDDVSKTRNRGSAHVARPNLDFAIGLSWQHCFCDWYVVTVRTGWEYHHYFDQNFFRSAITGDDSRGSLTLHGLTVGAGIQF